MKNTIFILFVLFCHISCTNNQPQSTENDSSEKLSKNKEKSLIALGQLWGFLKYHHPAVAEGQYDWDMELIKLIPFVYESKDESEWKTILDNWMDSLPAIEKNPLKKLPDLDAKIKPDYGELFNTEYFYPETIDKIKYLLENAVVSSNYYVDMENESRLLKNELPYEDLLYPDLSFRLLALYRYWNIINYFFPYRDLTDQKWADVLPEMLPEFVYAENHKQYFSACMKLITKIDDSHAYFAANNMIYHLMIGVLDVPFVARFIEDKLVVTMYTGENKEVKEKIGIGDVITAIDGEPVDNIIKKWLPYTPASNYAVKLRQIAPMILRGNANMVVVTVLREGIPVDITVPRYDLRLLKVPNYYNPQPDKEGYLILENNIGYVLPSSCKVEDRSTGIKKVLDGTKGVIIDMRCYPGDQISRPFLKYLDHTSSESLLLRSYANISYPGYFFVKHSKQKRDKNQKITYKNKVIILVNEYTQSQAETHVLDYQTELDAIVIGSTTAGADGNVTSFSLPGSIRTQISGVGVYYPDGSDLQRVGVKIDEVVKPTIAGIKAGRDELLERAIEIINSQG